MVFREFTEPTICQENGKCMRTAERAQKRLGIQTENWSLPEIPR